MNVLPASALERIRLTLLVIAAGSAVVMLPAIATSGHPLLERFGSSLLVLVLCGYWVRGYRQQQFELALEPFEAISLYLVLCATPGTPFLPLFGLVFRSTYGSCPLAMLRYVVWMCALLGAHMPRGSVYMASDLNRALGLAVVPLPMQALRAALENLQTSERRMASLVQNSTDVVTVIGEDLRVRWQAESIRAVLGHEPSHLVGSTMAFVVHPQDRPALDAYFEDASRHHHGAPQRLELRLRHVGGGYRHFEVVASDRLHDPSVRGFVLNMRDATERHQLEESLRALAAQREHDALHDPLTGLANRRKLFAHLHDAIARATARNETVALLLIDLDRFKEINDTLGHPAGDQLLREMRPRLIAAGSGADLVARLGGDEFAVLLPLGSGVVDAELAATRLRRAIEQPFYYQGLTLLVRASLGIATFPDHAVDVETLVQRADIAVYSAKSRNAGHEVYHAARDAHSRERLTLIGELPKAISCGELVVHYQPKFALDTDRMTGVEALVRWQHPRLGLLGPGAFLPLAEQTGLMRPLTLQVLDDALEQATRWQHAGIDMKVAVNLAAPNLLDAALPSDVAALLQRHGVEPARLQLEITETMVSADPEHVVDVLSRLRQLGVSLSLDDFGTGSSSLSFLRRLPVQELKIDKSFVLGMDDDAQAAAIVRTVIDLAHNLGLQTVAEGIETEEVRSLLASFGCDQGQGFLMARPIPADEVTAMHVAARGPLAVATSPRRLLPAPAPRRGGPLRVAS